MVEAADEARAVGVVDMNASLTGPRKTGASAATPRTRGRRSCACFPGAATVRAFIETTDSHKFCVALQRRSSPRCTCSTRTSTSTSDARIASANASNVGQTERMSPRGHGFLRIADVWIRVWIDVVAALVRGERAHSRHRSHRFLRRARRRGDLVVSAPGAALRFLPGDSEALETRTTPRHWRTSARSHRRPISIRPSWTRNTTSRACACDRFWPTGWRCARPRRRRSRELERAQRHAAAAARRGRVSTDDEQRDVGHPR